MVGAVVGLAVNILVLPPLPLRSLQRAVSELARRTRQLLADIADGLCGAWNADDAREWSQRARTLDETIRRADEAARRGRESTWMNPWWRLHRRRRSAPAAYEPAIDDLREIAGELKRMTASLDYDGDSKLEPDFTADVALMLTSLAEATTSYERPWIRYGKPKSVASWPLCQKHVKDLPRN
jgi:hypothetical protein